MQTITKQWSSGIGEVTINYDGSGNGQITVSSDDNNLYEERSMDIVVSTTAGSPTITRTVSITQAAKQRIDISAATVTAPNQTYSGSAKTPTPTVVLNGTTIPSTGYDVSYSNNVNAGTATVTVTGKGDYTGTASGTFSIAKAGRTLSFPNAYVVLAPSGNITKTATPSAGSGDGAITYSIGSTTYATINSSSGKVTAKTTEGNTTVTATIAEGTNYLGATATYTLYVFATTHNYEYTASAKSLTLPPGSYKLQVWGAQGGSNAADGTYGITAQSGGKGGYSEGQLTVDSPTSVKVYVGGQGGASSGGWNGGGSSVSSSTYNADNTRGVSKFGGGGGASDIRSADGALLSRMIVAGGGSGGAMCCREIQGSETWETLGTLTKLSTSFNGNTVSTNTNTTSKYGQFTKDPVYIRNIIIYGSSVFSEGDVLRLNFGYKQTCSIAISALNGWSTVKTILYQTYNPNTPLNITIPSLPTYDKIAIYMYCDEEYWDDTITIERRTSYTPTQTLTDSQVGFVGGGTTGGGYSDTYNGKQNAAGKNGGFGQGANQTISWLRYVSAAGGGGWYGGGGGDYSNSITTGCKYSGGGSGWVNIAANAQYRPSGYTGLQLDSGSTKDGTQTFVSPGETNETGHSGNGYARITRL